MSLTLPISIAFREHEEFGYCQVGTSSSLLADDTMILGSPGPYTWRGTIFTQDTKDSIIERDHAVYMAPVEDGVTAVEKYSYLGKKINNHRFFKLKTNLEILVYYLLTFWKLIEHSS